MLHLALKAFWPGKPPFPAAACRHDVEVPRDDRLPRRDGAAARARPDRPHQPGRACAAGINPFASGSAVHTQVMKTEALRQALDKYGFDAAFGGARRDEEKSRAKERIFSHRTAGHAWEPRNQRPELWQPLQHPPRTRASRCASSRCPIGPSRHLGLHRGREHPRRAALFRQAAPRGGARRRADHGRRRAHAARAGRDAADGACVRFRTLGCYPLTGAVAVHRRHAGGRRRRDAAARASPSAQGRLIDKDDAGLDGAQEARGLFLMRDRALAAPLADGARLARRRAPGPAALPHLRLGRRRQVDPDRPAARRGEGACSRTSWRRWSATRAATARRARTSTSPCWSTGWRPSASRASPSTSPTASSPRRGAPSSSPTRPATSSTPATWRPAPRTPSSPSC